MFDEMLKTGIQFHKGAPTGEDLERWSQDGEHILLVLDDVMQAVCSSPEMMTLFTINCHHRNISACFLSQSAFPPGKCARTISLNCHYIVLFKTKRDRLQVQSLGRQMLPGQSKYFADAYEDATAQPWGYLLCDLHPATDDLYQLRTHIFPGEELWYYTPYKEDVKTEERSVEV